MADGTKLTGTFKDCGHGHPPQIDYACQGPSCTALDQFPLGLSSDTQTSVEYKSAARCEAFNSMYFGPMLFTQPDLSSDHRVSQEQNITLPNCKGLHIYSDGTSIGTHVDGVTRTGPEPECLPQPPETSQGSGPAQSSAALQAPSSSMPVGGYIISGLGGAPTSIAGGETLTVAETPPTNAPNPTESQPAQFTGSATHRKLKTSILLALFVGLTFFIQGSAAYLVPSDTHGVRPRSPIMGPDTERRTAYKHRVRALSDNIRTFAGEFGGYLAGKVEAVQEDGEVFSDSLISETLSTICEGFFSGAVVEAFAPGIVDACVTAVYTTNAVVAPEAEFLAVFGASMFCNYLVSQAFPIAEQFSSEACQGLEDLISPEVPTASVLPSLPPTVSPSESATPSFPPTISPSESATPSLPPIVSPSESVTPISPPTASLSESVTPTLPPTVSPSTQCGGADLMSDDNNCGTCGFLCGDFEDCINGKCIYRGGFRTATSQEVSESLTPPPELTGTKPAPLTSSSIPPLPATSEPSSTVQPRSSTIASITSISSTLSPSKSSSSSTTISSEASEPSGTCSTHLLSDPLNCGGCNSMCTRGPCVNGWCVSSQCANYGSPCGVQDGCSCLQYYSNLPQFGLCANMSAIPDECPPGGFGSDECNPDTGPACPSGKACVEIVQMFCGAQFRCVDYAGCQAPITPVTFISTVIGSTPVSNPTPYTVPPESSSTITTPSESSSTAEPLATAGSWSFVVQDSLFWKFPDTLYAENPAWLLKDSNGDVTINTACITNSEFDLTEDRVPFVAGAELEFTFGQDLPTLEDICCLDVWGSPGCAGPHMQWCRQQLLNPGGTASFDVLSWKVSNCNSLYTG